MAISGRISAALVRADRRFGRMLPARVRAELIDRYCWKRQKRAVAAWKRQPAHRGVRVRVGFVGAGTYAQHHLAALTRLPDVTVSALLITGGPRAKTTAARFGVELCSWTRTPS